MTMALQEVPETKWGSLDVMLQFVNMDENESGNL